MTTAMISSPPLVFMPVDMRVGAGIRDGQPTMSAMSSRFGQSEGVSKFVVVRGERTLNS